MLTALPAIWLARHATISYMAQMIFSEYAEITIGSSGGGHETMHAA